MTDYYVSSVDGNNAAPPSVSWWNGNQSTYQTILGVFGVMGAGTHRVFVDSDHAHSYTAAANIFNITLDAVTVISVDRGTGDYLPGAREDMGSAAAALTLQGAAGVALWMGLTFRGSTNNSTSADVSVGSVAGRGNIFVDCDIGTLATSSGALLTCGAAAAGGLLQFYNCNILMPNRTGAGITTGGPFQMYGCTFEMQATQPSSLITNSTSTSMHYLFEGCDFSAFTGNYIFDFNTAAWAPSYRVIGCKKHATPDWVNPSLKPVYGYIEVINSDDGDTRIVYELHRYEGALLQSSSVYMDGGAELMFGASDKVPISWQLVTSAAASEQRPFVLPDIRKLIDSTSSQNFRMEIVRDSATDLTDTEVWLEALYTGNASFPLATLGSSVGANRGRAAGSNLAASSETWTGTGGFANENKQKVVLSGITPAEKSMGRFALMVGKPSTTIYINPQVLS